METKFNFNSQVCTDKNQSERLLALGLKKETADCYLVVEKEEVTVVAKPYYEIIEDLNSLPFDAEIIPAWSLHKLWELLGKIKKYEGEDELLYPRISLVEDDVIFESPKSIWVRQNFCSPKGVYENIINCFEELIKKGYFNKEYLV